MCELIFSLQDFLKIVPGLAIFPLSFYLAWKKLGTNVVASTTFGFDRTTASRITCVDLSNLKDRPIAIYSMHAVVNESVTYEIDKFEPPLILKALESLRIETKPYSRLRLGIDAYEPEFYQPNRIDIYLVLADRLIKCRTADHSSFLPIRKLGKYQKAAKETSMLNGLVYNEHAAFAITYKQEGHVKTAIVDSSGFIGRGWDYKFNMIPVASMNSAEEVRKTLEQAGFGRFVEGFAVDDLRRLQQSLQADSPASGGPTA